MRAELRNGGFGDSGDTREGGSSEKGKAVTRREAGDGMCSGSWSLGRKTPSRDSNMHRSHRHTDTRTRQATAVWEPDRAEEEKRRASAFTLHMYAPKTDFRYTSTR